MIRAQIQKDGKLKITADNEGRADLKAIDVYYRTENLVGEELAAHGFQFVRPEWIGALTDAPILTNELIGEDFSISDPPENVGDTWWFPDYQITDPWEVLKNTGRVIFEPEENNKSLPKRGDVCFRCGKPDPLAKGPHYCRECKKIIRAAQSARHPQFYECGICGAYHRAEWNGDCREDAERFDEIPSNAVLIDMEDLPGRAERA
jgi:hypothetical protein